MSATLRHWWRGRPGPGAWAAAALLLAASAQAALITPGLPTTGVPAGLSDPLATLAGPLPAGRFLLPIEVSGASDLQDWSFDLSFDDAVVVPLDAGGLYQSVYQAEFSLADPMLSDITSSGLVLPGAMLGLAGFSWGVSGDGTLAFLLFEYRAGQEGQDPGFVIDPPASQPVPAPPTPWLLASALLALAATRRGGRPAASTPPWRP
jgi:hypothetical protein